MASFKAKFPVLQELFAKNHRGGPFGPPPAGRGLRCSLVSNRGACDLFLAVRASVFDHRCSICFWMFEHRYANNRGSCVRLVFRLGGPSVSSYYHISSRHAIHEAYADLSIRHNT